MDSLNRGWISHLRKSEAHFNLPAISVCVCAAGALLNFTLLLYLWCNIPGCECSVRGKKRTCCFLVIFSFFPQQVGNKPTSSLSIFSSYKMKTEIVPPPPPPSSLTCSWQTLQPAIYTILLFLSLGKAKELFSPHSFVFTLLYLALRHQTCLDCMLAASLHFLWLLIPNWHEESLYSTSQW